MSYADIMRAYARMRGMRLRHDSRARADALPLQPVARAGHAALRADRAQAHREHRPLHRGPGRSALEPSPSARSGWRRRSAAPSRSEESDFAATRWSDALSSSGDLPSWGGVQFGSRLVDSRTIAIDASAADAFQPIQRIGGDTGWYAWNWLWQVRGFLDLLAGGVGMRRGRRSPTDLRVGDTVDFWRVEALERGSPAAARRRDEGAGAGLAGVRGDHGGRDRDHPADRDASIRWGFSAAPTGTRSTRCTSWCSAACCGASRGRRS